MIYWCAFASPSHTTIFYIKRTKKVRFGGSVEQVSESAWKYFIWISTLMMLRSVRIDSRTHSKWSNELFLQQWQDFSEKEVLLIVGIFGIEDLLDFWSKIGKLFIAFTKPEQM